MTSVAAAVGLVELDAMLCSFWQVGRYGYEWDDGKARLASAFSSEKTPRIIACFAALWKIDGPVSESVMGL